MKWKKWQIFHFKFKRSYEYVLCTLYIYKYLAYRSYHIICIQNNWTLRSFLSINALRTRSNETFFKRVCSNAGKDRFLIRLFVIDKRGAILTRDNAEKEASQTLLKQCAEDIKRRPLIFFLFADISLLFYLSLLLCTIASSILFACFSIMAKLNIICQILP